MGRRRQVQLPVATGQQEKPATSLRHSISLQRYRLACGVVIASVLQSLKETAQRLGVRANILNSRDVLHEHDVGLAPLDEGQELKEQRYAVVLVGIGAGGVLLRERLAGGASAEEDGTRPVLSHELVDRRFVHLANVLGLEGGLREVPLEGAPGVGVPIEREHDVHAGFLEPAARTPAAGEEVEHLHSHIGAGGWQVGAGNSRVGAGHLVGDTPVGSGRTAVRRGDGFRIHGAV